LKTNYFGIKFDIILSIKGNIRGIGREGSKWVYFAKGATNLPIEICLGRKSGLAVVGIGTASYWKMRKKTIHHKYSLATDPFSM
jgi:hypothetical protein